MNAPTKYRSGPIMVISAFPNTQALFTEAFKILEIPNKINTFSNGEDVIKHLRSTEEFPFMVFCDVDLPQMSGLELKKVIENDKILSLLCIPFIFVSDNPSFYEIHEGFYLKAQGYFDKPKNIVELEQTLKMVISYWSKSELPVL
jgi:CheY-like chemotaxis protein